MSKYVNLANMNTGYAKRMNRLSARIFGEPLRPTHNRSMKVVKIFSEMPADRCPEITSYYPRHPEIGWLMRCLRLYGLYRDEHEDFNEEIERLRVLRGKKPRHGYQGKKDKKEAK
ncbi:28S ribosomal protein S33, mitochondrial [Chelonus insularis]|uniref:28S ribosomal protein S33, mitochondrial n=1 Tax=Chelonus insularis TaxID=460826 RepID=UPI001589D433|nr:28S ribosomal protein S33, mitochondrial [Chelonus insularis]